MLDSLYQYFKCWWYNLDWYIIVKNTGIINNKIIILLKKVINFIRDISVEDI